MIQFLLKAGNNEEIYGASIISPYFAKVACRSSLMTDMNIGALQRNHGQSDLYFDLGNKRAVRAVLTLEGIWPVILPRRLGQNHFDAYSVITFMISLQGCQI